MALMIGCIWHGLDALQGTRAKPGNHLVIHKCLLDEQFELSLVDPRVYTRNKDEPKVTIILWVDDTIVPTNNTQSLLELTHSLKVKYS